MHVLISDPYFSCGGTEERIKALAEEFRKRGHKTTFLIHGEPGNQQKGEGFTVYHTTANMSRQIADVIIKGEKIDIVQQHNYQQVGAGAILAAEQNKIPPVYYAHDFCSICPRRFLTNGQIFDAKPCLIVDKRKCVECTDHYSVSVCEGEREILQHATIGISPSNYFTRMLEAHNVLNGKWRKITPWINPYFRDLFWSGYCSNTILYAGNLSPGKGAYTLIEALPAIVKEVPDVKVRFVCSGNNSYLLLKAKQLKVHTHIQIASVVPSEQLALEYVNAGVVAFPSKLPEAFGLVWAEAMTVGAPVVVSAVGSIPEYAQGRLPLVDANDVAAWSEALLTVLQDRKGAVELAEQNRDWAIEQFSVERAATEILSLYGELV